MTKDSPAANYLREIDAMHQMASEAEYTVAVGYLPNGDVRIILIGDPTAPQVYGMLEAAKLTVFQLGMGKQVGIGED